MKTTTFFFTALCLLAVLRLAAPAHALDALSPAGKSFIKDAASANLMEAQLGQVARDKGASQEVKDYGNRMVLEHSNANESLKTIANQKNLKLPGQVERRHAVLIAKLSNLSSGEFDRKYLQAMVQAHLKNLARYRKAVKQLKDQDLKAWAATEVPVLEEHLELAKQLIQTLGRR